MAWTSLRPEHAALVLVVVLAGCSSNGPAQQATAVAPACNIPAQFDLPSTPDLPDAKPDPVPAQHLLSLSWSPEFCRFRKDAPEHKNQCRDNHFGFVLHGLWPQAAGADEISDHPRNCAVAPPISEALVRKHFCMTPSAKLLQHEWHAHGTCGWKSAEAYFADAAQLWARTMRPDFRKRTTPVATVKDIRDDFITANPGLPRDAIYVERSNNGWLEEVRLCLDLDYVYAACDGGAGASDTLPISVWRGG